MLLKKVIKWILVILSTPILLLILFNAVDEDLKPEAQALLSWQSPADVLNDNGYIVLLGLDAPANEDAKQAGIKRYQDELVRYQTARKTHIEPFASRANLPPEFADKKWKIYRCDYEQQENCVEFYRHFKAQDLTEFYASQQLLEARFNAIKQSKQYTEAMPPLLSVYFPSYSNLGAASELARMKAVRLIADGKVDEGMAFFVENSAFSRQLIKNSTSLISRMVAVSMLQKDIRILSELVTEYPAFAIDFSQQLSSITTTISSPDYSFLKPMQHERDTILQSMYQLQFQMSQQANVLSKFMTKLFFQPNATVNLFYDWWQLNLDSFQASPQKLTEVERDLQKKQQALLGWGYAPYYIKNPVAKILVSVAQPDYMQYLERQHDLEGYIQLTALEIELSKLHVSDDNAESQLDALFEKHLNPYTGKPMHYDANKHQISFEGHQQSKANFGGSRDYLINLTH